MIVPSEGDRILISALHRPSYPQDPARDLDHDAPLETVANRSVPMACGPNVDQVCLTHGESGGRVTDLASQSSPLLGAQASRPPTALLGAGWGLTGDSLYRGTVADQRMVAVWVSGTRPVCEGHLLGRRGAGGRLEGWDWAPR
jgi:hypothetical protein